jgi:hypothetical protein
MGQVGETRCVGRARCIYGFIASWSQDREKLDRPVVSATFAWPSGMSRERDDRLPGIFGSGARRQGIRLGDSAGKCRG